MRVLFMGTPQLAATILDALARRHDIVGVFTRPDAVRGRGKRLVASPVKQKAVELGCEVFTPQTLKGGAADEIVRSLNPDVICVAAYGCILPKSILDMPEYGCLNVHTSLLPRWRGAAPIERAILAGDEQTGVCIMRMEEGLDTGPYCVRRTVEVDGLYLAQLASLLANEGSEALLEALDQVVAGSAMWTVQGEDGLTYAHKLEKDELDCAPDDSVRDICAKVRVASESRPAKLSIAGRKLAVERAESIDTASFSADALPDVGEATFVAKRLVIGARDGSVEVQQVKPDGKKSMEGRAFAAGIQGIKGTRVEWGRA